MRAGLLAAAAVVSAFWTAGSALAEDGSLEARLARVEAVVPPAPTTFSITSCWPSVRDMCSPMMREITSVGPPAANGTISVMFLVG